LTPIVISFPVDDECQRIARDASLDAMRRLIELMGSDNEPVALMAGGEVVLSNDSLSRFEQGNATVTKQSALKIFLLT
jgi:hypothetical protein